MNGFLCLLPMVSSFNFYPSLEELSPYLRNILAFLSTCGRKQNLSEEVHGFGIFQRLKSGLYIFVLCSSIFSVSPFGKQSIDSSFMALWLDKQTSCLGFAPH